MIPGPESYHYRVSPASQGTKWQIAVHSPNVRILHAHDNIVIVIQESTVEVDNVFGMTAMHNLQLSNDSLSNFTLRLDVDHLQGL